MRKPSARQALGLVARADVAGGDRRERLVDLLAMSPKRIDTSCPRRSRRRVAGHLLGRAVHRVDAPLQVGRDDARADRLDDALVQRAQARERVRRLAQLHLGARLPLGEARRQQPDDEEGHVVEPGGLCDLRERGRRQTPSVAAQPAPPSARASSPCSRDGAADRRHQRAARAEEDARHRDDEDVERRVRRVEIARHPDKPGHEQRVDSELSR